MVIYNSVGTYGAGPRKTPAPGFVEIHQSGILRATLHPDHLRGRGFRILYTPLTDVHEHFDAVCKVVLAARDCVFLIDEVWLFQKTAWSPRDLQTMMLMGRHYGITLVWTAQRPAKTDSTLRSVSTEIYVGSLPSSLDQKCFYDSVPQEALDLAAKLPPRQFVHRKLDLTWVHEK